MSMVRTAEVEMRLASLTKNYGLLLKQVDDARRELDATRAELRALTEKRKAARIVEIDAQITKLMDERNAL
jgi:uncharacterized coiled-coil protein SlyX